jgi:lysozyme
MVNPQKMARQLVLHEGLKLRPYKDTLGNWTIGVGYNVASRGWEFLERVIGRKVLQPGTVPRDSVEGVVLTKAEALAVLDADISRVEKAVVMHFPEYKSLSEIRQRVCVDMAFNLGMRALGFKDTIAAVKEQNWSRAAMCLYRSKWAYQVGDGPGGIRDRADRLASMILTNQECPELASPTT